MTDRRQIAEEIWHAFKGWQGEKKYALRAIRKHLLGQEWEMSTWRYQIMQHVDDNGHDFLAIHEYYTLHDGKYSWTAKPILIEAESLKDMRMALIDILKDAERHGVLDAKTGQEIEPPARRGDELEN
jgi:hypothetical protein